jgi:hypothetical protein
MPFALILDGKSRESEAVDDQEIEPLAVDRAIGEIADVAVS